MKKWKKISAVVGLVLSSTCGGLAAGELGLRLVGPRLWGRMMSVGSDFPWLVYHPVLGWVNRPGTSNTLLDRALPAFLINALGFRGPETSVRKPSGWLRIVCLGDSRTFGVWLDAGRFRYDNDYPAALERSLHDDAGGKHVEVINTGVLGYTSAHGLTQLQTQVLKLHPDIITVAFGFNDHSLAWNPALAAREPRNPFARESFYFASHSYWFQLGKAVYDSIGALHAPPLSERWVDPEAYEYDLHRFAEVARRHRIHVLFVSQAPRPLEMGESAQAFPEHPQDKAGLYFLLGVKDLEDLHRLDRSYRDLLYKVAEEEGVPVADAAAAFAERRELLFGQYDMMHCNPAGARVIAETIRHKLLELGWLLSPESRRGAAAATSPTER